MTRQSSLAVGIPLRPEHEANATHCMQLLARRWVVGRSSLSSSTVISMLQPSETRQAGVVECQCSS